MDTNFDNKFINSFIKCNELRLNLITDEAIEYIKNISSKFDCSNMFVSFSGGKDSTVTSDLVMKALNNESIIHFYGDTTLEYPTTEEYIKSFKCEHKKTPLLVASNKEQDFNNLCEIIGPPSRVMRWCCTVFKTGAITRKIEQTFKNTKRLLSFQGIRRLESLSRSKYERDTDSPKITKQLVSAPIIDWSDFDVWLYILSNKITFNKAYCQGFSRVGCWCCPNNSAWSEYLSAIYMNDKYAAFKNTLYSFAKKVGKQDWKEYIDEGNWRARQGGNGLEHSKNAVVSFKPCALDENSVNFTLSREISEDFYTFLKPFGIVNFDIGNKRLGEVYVLSRITMEPIFKVSGKIGKNELKITINNVVKPYKNAKEIIDLFRNQITKYQTCIGCTYCQSVCKFNALKVNNLNKGNVSTDTISYIIDENKCVGCLECVKHFDGGCYMKKVLRTKKGE
ncbi:MAG: phosphoadenosine phosphosulfate reductase family protein [Bacilli bacterium]